MAKNKITFICRWAFLLLILIPSTNALNIGTYEAEGIFIISKNVSYEIPVPEGYDMIKINVYTKEEPINETIALGILLLIAFLTLSVATKW